MTNVRRTRHGARRGLSIAEVLLSLAISSMLLLGVAGAYNGSANAVESNDVFFRSTQAGRVTLNQLLSEIRRADSVVTATTNDSVIITRPLEDRMTEEQSREFKYDAAGKKVTLQIYFKKADGTTYQSPVYTMARNVASATFGPPDTLNGVEVRIPITVIVTIGSNTVRLSDTASPRRVTGG